MITDIELQSLRADSIDYLPDTIHVYTPTPSRSNSGGTLKSYPATPTTAAPGRIAPMSNTRKAWYAEKLGGRQGWTITVPFDEQIAVTSRFGVGTRRFEIIGGNADRTYQITQRFDCVEVL